MLVYSILTDKHSLEKLIFSSKYRARWKLSFRQHFTDNPSVPSRVSHFMFVVHGWLNTAPSGAVLKRMRRSELPRLLDEKGPGRVGLLHRRPHLAVPHTHRSLWKVMAQLQTHQVGKFITHKALGPERRLNNPVWNLLCKVRTGFLERGCFCLPCREFLPEECQLVASCWRWQGTCCKSTRFKHQFLFNLKQIPGVWSKCCWVFFEFTLQTRAAINIYFQ